MGGQGRHAFFLIECAVLLSLLLTVMNQMPEQPASMGHAPALQPQSIKVFGVLHLVFGGIGLFFLLYAIAQLAIPDVFIQMSAAGDENMVKFQEDLQEKLFLPSLISVAISAVLSVLILRAGLMLVKAKKGADKASHLYAWASIAGKAVALVLALLFTIPATSELVDVMIAGQAAEGTPDPILQQTMGITKVMMSITGVLSPVVMCLYPILSLVLLKKKAVADYLAGYGK